MERLDTRAAFPIKVKLRRRASEWLLECEIVVHVDDAPLPVLQLGDPVQLRIQNLAREDEPSGS